jgi:hypothetical protein
MKRGGKMLPQLYRASILFVLGTLFTSLTLVLIANVITNIPLVLENSRSVLNSCPNPPMVG